MFLFHREAVRTGLWKGREGVGGERRRGKGEGLNSGCSFPSPISRSDRQERDSGSAEETFVLNKLPMQLIYPDYSLCYCLRDAQSFSALFQEGGGYGRYKVLTLNARQESLSPNSWVELCFLRSKHAVHMPLQKSSPSATPRTFHAQTIIHTCATPTKSYQGYPARWTQPS